MAKIMPTKSIENCFIKTQRLYPDVDPCYVINRLLKFKSPATAKRIKRIFKTMHKSYQTELMNWYKQKIKQHRRRMDAVKYIE